MSEQNVSSPNDTTPAGTSELDAAQVAEIGGGADNCTVTVQFGTDGVNYVYTGSSVGDALVQAYEGLVDAASHVIGRVLGP